MAPLPCCTGSSVRRLNRSDPGLIWYEPDLEEHGAWYRAIPKCARDIFKTDESEAFVEPNRIGLGIHEITTNKPAQVLAQLMVSN